MKTSFVVAAALLFSMFASQHPGRIMAWLDPNCCAIAMNMVAAGERDDDDEDQIEEWMEKVHEGKRSPFRQIKEAVRNDPPHWDVIEKQLPKLVKMSELLGNAKNDEIKDSSDGYVESTNGLGRALKVKDAKAVRKAFNSLGESCADCHFKGGVGGKLDD